MTGAVGMKRWHLSSLSMSRFYARKNLPGAVLWGFVFGISVASSALGFIAAYNGPASREALAKTFGSNVGLKVLLGAPARLDTVAGFTVWRSLGIIIIIGAIWALLTASKAFRGEEVAGRWEVFLVGQTTMRRATANIMLALGADLAIMYALAAAGTIAVGHSSKVGFGVQASLFFALAVICSAAMCLAAGALASQIMPIRSRTAALTAGFFGVSFGIRAIANAAPSAHWLINLSPLGWVENLQPFINPQPIWLLPIGGLIVVFITLALWLAGRRDLGASVLADKDTAKPRFKLLNAPLPAAFRLTRTSIIGWLVAVGGVCFVFGFIAKSAGQAFNSFGASKGAGRVITRLAHEQQITGSTTFLGIIFMIAMLLIMAIAASSIANLREDEAEGYLENLVVRPVGRLQWLRGRLLLIVVTIGAAGILAAIFSWVSAASQHSGVSFHVLILAGINAMAPAALVAGLGVLILGFLPRLTAVATYGLIAWSFLLEIIGSAINLNHWILDTSLLHDIALAPATNPDWQVVIIFVVIGVAGALLGAWRFNRRDLASE